MPVQTPLASKSDAKKTPEMPSMIGEKLFKSRQIQLTGAVDEKVARAVISALLALEADDREAPITMIVNSPGGSVTAGFAIYDMMHFIQPRIRVVCAGLAASIATVILLGADKADRLSLPNTRLLIHQPMIPSTVYGPASDLEITANELLKTRERINQLLAEQTGQDFERIQRDTQRDYWLTADEAVAYGLISRVISKRSELDG